MPSNDPRQQLPSIRTTNLEEAATGAIYQVIKEFSARLEDELTLTLGDKIEVISDDKEYNDGWYMGKSLTTGAVGLYPKSFTQLIPSLSRPSLLRSRSRRIASPSSANNQSPVSLPSASASATPILNKTQHQFIAEEPGEQSFELTPDMNKKDSVNGALSDIDKALEELRSEATPNANNQDRPRSYSVQSEDSLNPEQVESWTPEQVTAYFSYLGFDVNSAGQFARHKITGAILLELELAYLKELDILSFGTRFEMFKEIEALKELANQKQLEEANGPYSNNNGSNRLMAPAELHSSNKTQGNNRGLDDDLDTFTRPLGHARKKSQSLDDIPEITRRSKQFQNPVPSQPQRHSLRPLSINPPSSQVPQLPQSPSQFASPRRAPNPPSYPSPVQLKEDNFNQLSPSMNKRSSYIESSHSRKPSYEVNAAFQPPYSHSRSNSNFKSQSVSDLLSTTHLDNGRPASSIYMDTQQNHSRNSSAQFRRGHLRGNSEASVANSQRPSLGGNGKDRAHRRHSSVFSFLSNTNFNNGGSISPTRKSPTRPSSVIFHDKSSSPVRDSFKDSKDSQRTPQLNPSATNTPTLQSTPQLPAADKRRSVSAKEPTKPESPLKSPAGKRSVSEAVRAKTLRNISSSTALRSKNTKKDTSAFMEGIRNTNPADSIKSADCFGWMSKRGGIAVGTWKQRYFTLHGTRLSYFTSLSDTRERGLIDITSHKVLPAKEDDKLVSLYAASTGHGKFCFKLVPPAPGSRKGLTFTQPKIHYFAVESKEEMRTWMAALIKATIDIDESVPIISSCATPTVSLQKAQTLLVQARENARRREDAYRQQNLVNQEPPLSQSSQHPATRLPPSSNENSGTSSISPDSGSFDSNIPTQSPNTTATTSEITPISQNGENGFSSPYVIASGFVSPKSNPTSANHSPIDQEFKSKPYSANATRQPSQRVSSSASAAAAAAVANKNRISDGANRI